MDIFGPEISNYGVVKFNSKSGNVVGLVENQSKFSSIKFSFYW